MAQYCILGRIGEGAHGIVFKAKHVEVVQLKAVFPHGACFVLALEFMLSDLAEVLRHAQRPLVQAQVKSYLQMLLKGVAFCHANNIVHRVSPSMGWSAYGPALGESMVRGVGACGWVLERVGPGLSWVLSLTYFPSRGPLGPLGELMRPLVPRGLETSQPAHQCLGPAEDSRLWPGPGPLPRWQLPLHALGGHQEITELPDYNKIFFKDQAPMPLGELLPDAPPQALDLLGHFVLYPPRQRIAASQALLHLYFFTAPLPAHPSELLIHQHPRGPAPEAHQGPAYTHDFHVDRPLEESLLNPELIRPFIPEG
ncbi:Cyclin-Dependent Kinase 20 [Manis pentadactyla]|nr:Cyclin-Dependent Kinase 20 [Manis pentadactyla]